MKQLLLLFLVAPLFTFGQWTQIGSNIEGTGHSWTGYSVSLSDDGTIMATGAIHAPGTNGTFSGRVRVYKNISGVWTQVGSDINGEAAQDESGSTVSLSGDGNIVAIAAIRNDGNGSDAGHMRVFENNAGVWTKIGDDIDGEAAGDFSGISVSLSNDGSILAVGAVRNDGVNGSDSGHVRVFQNISGTWTQIGSDIDGDVAGDWFGISVSLSNNGDILAVGAPNNDSNGTNSGRVKVLKNIAGTWIQIGSNFDGTPEIPYSRVSLNSDGSILAIGSGGGGPTGNNGLVRVFKNIAGTWTQMGSDILGEAPQDSATTISLNSNGTILAIGAPGNDGGGFSAGHVRVFQNISGTWTQIGADIDGETSEDFSGANSLSADGSVLAIGAYLYDGVNFGADIGYVRVFGNASLSVTTTNFGSQFRAQPNPSFGTSYIELGDFYQEVQVSIFDLLGKEVMIETYTNTNKIVLDTQKFTTGIYIVKVESNANKASLKLIVK